MRGALWFKLILNCAYNAVSAITQLPYGKTAIGEGVQAVMQDVVAECLAVAAADGVTIPGDVQAAVRGIASTMPSQYSSTAQDLARGKPTEIDHLNGYVVKRGAALGVPTSLNHALQVLVKLAEMKRVLQDIQSGKFTRDWMLENKVNQTSFKAVRARNNAHQIEEVGARLRGVVAEEVDRFAHLGDCIDQRLAGFVDRKAEEERVAFLEQIGSAFDNKDGSINVVLNATPLDGRLHIRLVEHAQPEATSETVA